MIPGTKDPFADQHSGDVWLTATNVCNRLGISKIGLYRWLRDERLNFPQPVIVRKRRYFRMSDLAQWEKHAPGASYNSAAAE